MYSHKPNNQDTHEYTDKVCRSYSLWQLYTNWSIHNSEDFWPEGRDLQQIDIVLLSKQRAVNIIVADRGVVKHNSKVKHIASVQAWNVVVPNTPPPAGAFVQWEIINCFILEYLDINKIH